MTTAAEAASGERWLCPDCLRLLTKPPTRSLGGERYHSYHCPSQMRLVRVTVEEIRATP